MYVALNNLLSRTFSNYLISVIKSTSTQDGNLVKVFSGEKKQNGDCNVRNFRRFLFGMSPDVPTVKVCGLTSDFKL